MFKVDLLKDPRLTCVLALWRTHAGVVGDVPEEWKSVVNRAQSVATAPGIAIESSIRNLSIISLPGSVPLGVRQKIADNFPDEIGKCVAKFPKI